MNTLTDKLGKNFIFFDGAMGTMLQKSGLPPGGLPEAFNFTHPEIVEDIHRRYAQAGADILTTNTFGANARKLAGSGFSTGEVIRRAMALARKHASGRLVALDMGPIGKLMEPVGDLAFEEAYALFREQVVAGAEAGADLILIETLSDLYEMKAAVLAAVENADLPVFCTLTFQEDGRTLTGSDPAFSAHLLGRLGATAVGVNCSLGPAALKPIVKAMAGATDRPILVQPNAGLPTFTDGETRFDLSPEAYASEMVELAESGAAILGGCCGTTPEFIRKTRQALEGLVPVRFPLDRRTLAGSSTKTVVIGEGPVLIGERINPTGKPALKAALRKGDFDYVVREALLQAEAGADILDVNVGLRDIDQKAAMVRAVKELQAALEAPLQIDSTKPEVIEAALRLSNGKPIVNSVNGEEKSLEAILPLAKKYGACVLGLTLNENGIPSTARERLEIAEGIVEKALAAGIPREDILIDCLVLTASAQQKEVFETLKALPLVKSALGVKTVLGVSNVSYGLPDREFLNSVFLSMALAAGLDAPIADPLSEDTRRVLLAYRVLSGCDEGAAAYLDAWEKAAPGGRPRKTGPPLKDLKAIVLAGMKSEAREKTLALLDSLDPLEIVNGHLIPALDEVGLLYENKKLYLPQLIRSAETVKASFEVIQSHLDASGRPALSKGRILLATVKGDVHDIGKNIVKTLLQNYGFEILDLGKNVSPETIAETAKRQGIGLVGLSALMTTTVDAMGETIRLLRREHPTCSVFVGGAVLSPSLARQIGADHYGKDARAAVAIARKHFETDIDG